MTRSLYNESIFSVPCWGVNFGLKPSDRCLRGFISKRQHCLYFFISNACVLLTEHKLRTVRFPTDEAVPNWTCALDKVLMDCGVLGAKTPKWSAAWQLIPDDVSHTFPDHCNARTRLKSRRAVCREPADGLGLIIRNHFPASAGRFRKVSRCDILETVTTKFTRRHKIF